jgi:hypothetical protein
MHAEMFESLSSRVTPAAFVAMNTPEEAIDEATYSVRELGMKVVVINGGVWRSIPTARGAGFDATAIPQYVDVLALDSPYDYEPVWQQFVDLRVAPMSHNSSMGLPDRCSPTSFVYNHLGHFAQAGHAFARAVFLGGVTRRFPDLRFAFLEGGVAWARSLCSDLIGHWAHRNEQAMLTNLRPSNLDVEKLVRLMRTHGDHWFAHRSDNELATHLDPQFPGRDVDALTTQERELDDFAAVGTTSADEVGGLFARNFYFGCEGDDVTTCLAFDERLGPRLHALFGSDVSHFDVADMADVLADAHGLVEKGLLTEADFRDLTFRNVVDLHAGANPAFFDGTVVAGDVRAELAAAPGSRCLS